MNRYMFYKVEYKKVWEDIKKKILYIKKNMRRYKKKRKGHIIDKKIFYKNKFMSYITFNQKIKEKKEKNQSN